MRLRGNDGKCTAVQTEYPGQYIYHHFTAVPLRAFRPNRCVLKGCSQQPCLQTLDKIRDAAGRDTADEAVHIRYCEDFILAAFKELMECTHYCDFITEEVINDNKDVKLYI